MNCIKLLLFLLASAELVSCHTDRTERSSLANANNLYIYSDVDTRWNSFENPSTGKGTGGSENRGAKGHPYDSMKAGESKELMNVSGSGIITRMWFTIRERTPEVLRSLKIEMFWDGEIRPAVSAPFGDFFCHSLGKMVAFENTAFASPEGRSFVCILPMPFKTGARVVLTNEGSSDITMLFYDINIVRTKKWDSKNLYFHCYWNRDTATIPGTDYTVLPYTTGKGRFVGVSFGVIANPEYEKSWWGEGEVKIYLDGDGVQPTLVGTGTEDYIGTAWGQGVFINAFSGCTVADTEKDQWAFYRFHIPDPVMFRSDIRVTVQTMGGNMKPAVIEMLEKGAPLIPVTIQDKGNFLRLMDMNKPVDLKDPSFIDGWTNFYRSDDWSSTAYFYLDKPAGAAKSLPDTELRIFGLK
ncbi:MAG: glycoside hydrolase family 172 protein [Bacteroidales bacterium]